MTAHKQQFMILFSFSFWRGGSCTVPVTMEAGQFVSENPPLKINLHEGEEREREGGREKEEGKKSLRFNGIKTAQFL